MNNPGSFCDITIQLFSRNVSFKSSSFQTRDWFKDNLLMNKMWVLMRDVLSVRTAGPTMCLFLRMVIWRSASYLE